MNFLLNRWAWSLVMAMLFLTITSVGGAALILASGRDDPPRATDLLWVDDTLSWVNGSAKQQLNTWDTSPQSLPIDTFTVEVVGTLYADATTLSAWGLWFQLDDDHWLVVGINGYQYVTARYCDDIPNNFLLLSCEPAYEPTQQINTVWKFFHLIQPINQTNTIQLSRLQPDTNVLALRFGGEWMWDIAIGEAELTGEWGIWSIDGETSLTFVQWTATRIWGNMQ